MHNSIGRAINTGAAITAALVLFACACAGKDDEAAALVGTERITRGFVSYAMEKLGAQGRGSAARREVIDGIVRNCLVAKKARLDRIDSGEDYRGALPGVLARTRMDFLCGELGIRGDCSEGLLAHLKRNERLAVPEVDWGRVFIRKERPYIPLGGVIPKVPVGGGLPSLNRAYADGISISSDLVKTTLAALVDGADENARAALTDYAVRERALGALVTDAHLAPLKGRLKERRRALLDEIETRASEALLAEIYRRRIGFESLSGGKSSSVRYPVSAREARAFYDGNKALFEEPVAVELSHIRLRDHAAARAVHAELVKDPGSFCGLARRHSIAPDASRCGDLGRVERRKGLPLVKEIGFTLARPGQVSVPFSTTDGVEIVRLRRREVRLRSFDDPLTRALIETKIQAVLRERKLAADIDQMKKRYPVTIVK